MLPEAAVTKNGNFWSSCYALTCNKDKAKLLLTYTIICTICNIYMISLHKLLEWHNLNKCKYVGNSISKLQIQVATYVLELSAGNCHR